MWTLLVAALVGLIIVKLIRLSLFWKGRNVPYEPYYLYLYRLFRTLNTRGYSEFTSMAVKQYGEVHGTYKGLTPTLATANLDHAKEILIKQFDKFFRRTFEFKSGEPIWDNIMPNLEYDKWKMMRNAMGLAFTSAKMRPMIAKFDVMAKRLSKKLRELAEANGGKFDTEFFTFAKMYSIDSTLAVAYGKDVNCVENPDTELLECTNMTVKPGLATLLFYAAPDLFQYVPGVHFPPKTTTDFFTRLAEQMLKEKRAKLDQVLAEGRADIIDRLLVQQRDEPRLTDELLTSQAFIFIVAGLDNTSLAITVTMYYLALFPEAQQRALEEIKSILGDRKEVQHDDLQKLKYVEGCILESLRFFPFKFNVDRVCKESTVVGDIAIEKGMIVEFLSYEMTQNSDYFPEPKEFKPERFMKSEVVPDQQLGAFLSFGDGPKHCAGKKIAVMNAQTVIVNLILALKIETCAETPAHPPKTNPGFDFVKLTQKPLVIRIKQRE